MSEERKVIGEQRKVMGEQREVMDEQTSAAGEKAVLAEVAVKTRNVNKGLAIAVILLAAMTFVLAYVAYNAINVATVVEYERQVNRYLLCKLLYIQGVKKEEICKQFDFESRPIW